MNSISSIDILIQERGLSRYSLADKIGVTEGTIRKGIQSNFVNTSADTVYKIADALGISMERLLKKAPAGASEQMVLLPILYQTGGGAFVELDRYTQAEPPSEPAMLIPNVAPDDQWYERLIGNSVNKIIPDGSLMHVVSIRAARYSHGDVVIAERTRDDRSLFERSAKVVKFTSQGLELWPASTDPQWQAPITLNDNPEDETVIVTIAGVVKRAVRNF